MPHTAGAQTHFTDCVRLTGNNATILIPSAATVSAGGNPLPANSEIAVFTADGLCVGAVVWKDEPTGFPIWGDDSQTEHKDGLANGEAMTYRVWDASAEREYDGARLTTEVVFSDAQPFYTSENAYAEDGIYEMSSFSIETGPTSSESPDVPAEFALHQNYPNPFNPRTTIRFELPSRADVRITVYNAAGQEIAVLADASMAAGSHDLRWEASGLPSGTYFYRLQTENASEVRPMILLK